VCCIVPLRSGAGWDEPKEAAYLMSSPMVALVVMGPVMLLYSQRLNGKGAVAWDSDCLRSIPVQKKKTRQNQNPPPDE